MAAPPPVIPRQATVGAGESVVIPLNIHGARGEQLEFIIRTKPRLGRVSAVAQTGVNSASVTYTAPVDAALGEDRFFYAVRSNDGVSAPGAVSISLVPKPALPPRIEAPDRVDFPVVMTGEEQGSTIEIRNTGSVFVNGTISVSEPWSFEGEAAYRIEPKGKVVFRLLFHSDKPGKFSGEAVLGPIPKKVIALSAEARSPIVARPEKLVIPGTDRGQTRMAALELQNQSDVAQSVSISAGKRLLTEKSVELPAQGKAQVPIFAEPGDGSAFTDVLRLSAGTWKSEVTVEAEPLKARFKWAEGSAAELRGVPGQPMEFTGWLTNDGGRPITVSLSVNTPFSVSPARETLGAGEKKPVKIQGDSLPPGNHAIEVTAASDAAIERLKVTYLAEAAAPNPPAQSKPGATSAAVLPLADHSDESGDDVPGGKAGSNRRAPLSVADYPNAIGNVVKDVGSNRASLVWPASVGPVADLHFEQRGLSAGANGEVSINWTPIPPARVDVSKDPRRADFTGLEPLRMYTVRVRSGDQALFTAQFQTLASESWINWRYAALIVLTGILSFVGWRAWKNRRKSGW